MLSTVKHLYSNEKYRKIVLFLEIFILLIIFSTLTHGNGVEWDEAFTHKLVTYNDFKGIIRETAADVHPPLYYFICKVISLIFGSSLMVYDWISIGAAVCSMLLSITFIYKRWGFLSSFLFNIGVSLAPTVLFYNLNVRMYSWMAFFTLGCILISMEIQLRDKPGFYWFLFFFFSICGVYTQYFAVFPICGAYLYLFLGIFYQKKWKKLIPFVIVCIGNILCFLPWLRYASSQFSITTSSGKAADEFEIFPFSFFQASTLCNLENADIILFVLFIFSFALLIFFRSRYTKEEFYFLIMLFINCLISIYGSMGIAYMNTHFFHWRYAFPTMVIIWFIFSLIFTRVSLAVSSFFLLFTCIFCVSSFRMQKSYEYEIIPYLERTEAFIAENIPEDALIVYDYTTFDTIYIFYLPGRTFLHFDDVNFETLKGKTFWFIQLGGSYFSSEEISKYGLEIEHYSNFGFMGMVKFDLEKVTVGK